MESCCFRYSEAQSVGQLGLNPDVLAFYSLEIHFPALTTCIEPTETLSLVMKCFIHPKTKQKVESATGIKK